MSSIAPVSAQRGRFARAARLAVLVGCGVAVAGCNSAIETVRSLRGINKNDPDPATAPFSGNMAAAEAAPYPNLASVPPPPTRATSAADRQKLTEKLITERAAAQAFASAAAAAAAADRAPRRRLRAPHPNRRQPRPARPRRRPSRQPRRKPLPPRIRNAAGPRSHGRGGTPADGRNGGGSGCQTPTAASPVTRGRQA